ncbi:MAG: ABC transporter ATP-binding protein [Actinobacteria bacterium]|nr:ABC transporter ATP-binding protein [Actinomycetota bacterium]
MTATAPGQPQGEQRADTTALALEIRNLAVEITGDVSTDPVLDSVSLRCAAGSTLAVVGESGSGKTMSFLAVMGLLPKGARVTDGEILLNGRSLDGLDRKARKALVNENVAMIFQDALAGLSPAFTVGQQLTDVLRYGAGLDKAAAKKRALEVLDLVRIPNAARRFGQYPHELSGGQRQRVMIGMGVALQPKVLVADEPTTALDVTLQEQVMELLEQLRRDLGMGLVIITHDLGVVSRYADEVAVMYAGRIVEQGPIHDLFAEPRHPYTAALQQAIPRPDRGSGTLMAIPGQPARLAEFPTGCAFAPRCTVAGGRARCATDTPALELVTKADAVASVASTAHLAACHFSAETAIRPDDAGPPKRMLDDSAPEVLVVDGLTKHFRNPERGKGPIKAVDGVSITLRKGETFGLVGESGCGKSTLSRMILGLAEPTSGTITVDGVADGAGSKKRLSDHSIQIVFQDPYASLDPRKRVDKIVGEPLVAAGFSKADRVARIDEMLDRVGLAGRGDRFPHQFSGGQRQRIGIARAVSTRPRILVMDEPVSALDVSMQAQVLNMMNELRDELGLSLLLISLDLSVIRQVTDRVAVMYLGRIVEHGTTEALYANPRHPYTQALLSAAPIPDPVAERGRERVSLVGEIGGGAPEAGCALAPRCQQAVAVAAADPSIATVTAEHGRAIPRRCSESMPHLLTDTSGHQVACHFSEVAVSISQSSVPVTA